MIRRLLLSGPFLLAACPSAGPGDPLECADGFRAQDEGCVDVDECATDNGGCGDAESFTCENIVGAAPRCHFDPTADWTALTAGVATLELGGSQPDSFVAWGEHAFPVIQDEAERAYVAAARLGDGRAVAFGHEGMLQFSPDDAGDGAQLVDNALRWAGRAAEPRVAVSPDFPALAERLAEEGWTVEVREPSDLDGFDVFVESSWNDHDDATLDALGTWMTEGHGLVAGGHAWYWAYSHEDPWANYSGNKMMGRAGLTWTAFGDVSAGHEGVGPEAPRRLSYAAGALDVLERHLEGSTVLDLDDQFVAADAVGDGIVLLPLDLDGFYARVLALQERIGPFQIRADAPLDRAQQPLLQLAVQVDLKYAESLPPERLAEHPIGADFPGNQPTCVPGPDATVTIDASYEGTRGELWYSGAGAHVWRSTGLYAAPGVAVGLEFPESAVDAGLTVLVGAHTDDLGGAETWTRYPRVTRSYPVASTDVVVGNAFGGLLYIRIPEGTDLGMIDVRIEGATPAPRFVLGVDDDATWLDERSDPAPWAEIEGDGLILTVPSSAIRELDSAQAVAAIWSEVLHHDAVLSATPEPRPRSERIVFDRQISAGWMHSGYPIMAHLESVSEVLDVPGLHTRSAWGPLHELGHNHQWGPWILPGTTEATCNLFSVYVSEELFSVPRDVAHEALTPEARAERIEDYLDGGADFWGQWSVWTALESYLQVEEAFGWEPITAVFAQYREMDDPPQDDAARIDRWVVELSLATGRDLSGFYEAWGFPLGAEVGPALSHLPPWEDHPLAGAR